MAKDVMIACDFNISNCSLLQYFLSRHTYNIDLTSDYPQPLFLSH